jgi:acetyl-CoA carboxylase biotin carboxyl carrier protein
VLTFEQIKELIDLVSERGLQGLEIERSGFRVKIDGKTSAVTAVVGDVGTPAPSVPSADSPGAAVAPASAETAAAPAESAMEMDEAEGLHMLRSPIVGTFYTSPSPDADPYVHVGDRVKRGQVLCIVEAMKLMNEIESDEDGVIERVYPNNAQPVEYGEPLFAVRRD